MRVRGSDAPCAPGIQGVWGPRRYPGAVMTQNMSADSGALTVRTITAEEHSAFLMEQPASSFLQNPRWPQVKTDWRGEPVGIFEGGRIVAAVLVLHRPLPVPDAVPLLGRRSLAYMAEGPVIAEDAPGLEELLPPLTAHLKRQGAFLIRMGLPGTLRRWEAKEVRRALAAGEHRTIWDLDEAEFDAGAAEVQRRLKELGWTPPAASEQFDAGQPRFQARISLEPAPAGEESEQDFQRRVDAALSRMDQTSRRQTRKSARSELTVTVGSAEDLPEWQKLYEATAERDGFTGRPLEYFQRMHRELNASENAECTLYFAHYENQPLAAAIYVRQGEFGWYVYGASSTDERKRYAPRALQLRQIEDSLRAGCRFYDLGGLSPSLDPEYELAGLTRFKTTMGADVVETHGEWDYPVSRLLTKAFTFYMSRR